MPLWAFLAVGGVLLLGLGFLLGWAVTDGDLGVATEHRGRPRRWVGRRAPRRPGSLLGSVILGTYERGSRRSLAS
jgi:hypothetical protein